MKPKCISIDATHETEAKCAFIFETLALDPKKEKNRDAAHTCTSPSKKEVEFERKYSLDDRRSVAMASSENVCEKSLRTLHICHSHSFTHLWLQLHSCSVSLGVDGEEEER